MDGSPVYTTLSDSHEAPSVAPNVATYCKGCANEPLYDLYTQIFQIQRKVIIELQILKKLPNFF